MTTVVIQPSLRAQQIAICPLKSLRAATASAAIVAAE